MSDVVIIGGGVIGLLCARELAKAGATVTILDKQKIGQESSWAGGGILSPLYPWRQSDSISRLALRGQQLYSTIVEELIDANNADPELEKCGLLVHAIGDIQDALKWCKNFHQNYDCLTTRQIAAKLPPCRLTEADSLWFSNIGHIRNPRLIKALLADLNRLNVRILEHHPVEMISQTETKVTAVQSQQLKFNADHYIFACGAWSSLVLQNVAPTVQVKPIQGQMLIYQTKPGTLPSMVLTEGRYLIPRRDGKVLVGSTVAERGFDKTPDTNAYKELTEFAQKLMPEFRSQRPIHHWAGLRPGTDNGVPYIDRHPELENMFINCGHFRNGLVMGPAAAELTLDLILKRESMISPTAYRLSQPH